ncbi:uncharacterized protein LOC142616631 [Castanea sativa]|uniref:uncharacterized protein LOC142616631 n=1 Tax=Castanea sativa TaxID=21020 RepID=UPI003F652A1C
MPFVSVKSQFSASTINLSSIELQDIITQAIRMAGNASLSTALLVLPKIFPHESHVPSTNTLDPPLDFSIQPPDIFYASPRSSSNEHMEDELVDDKLPHFEPGSPALASLEGGGDSFVTEGFRNWKKKEKLQNHVGDHNSAHNIAQRKCEALLNQRQSIQTVINKQSDVEKREYRTRLNASVDCICFLLRQRLAFRGHDESKDSNNQGNFFELLRFLANHNEEIDKAVLENAPENHQMTSPNIQKEIANVAAVETINAIIKDIGDSLFAIIVDESHDMSTKEQMAIALRYVDKLGHVNERFLSITHVNNTSAVTLKSAIEEVFNKHSLSISRLRGQGYDGANNMRGELNGLKTLILKDNPSAYYVHCFAHQLQLTLVAVAKNHIQIATFFNLVAKVFNIVGASCKRHDILREKRNAEVIEALKNNEISTGRGLNQEMSLKRPGDTRWSSHYGALVNIIHMFSSVIDVIETIIEDGLDSDQRAEANILIGLLQTFEFVFDLHLMKGVLGISNELSQALQRKDQDIVNAMKLVDISKQRLQVMRDDGWNFC